MEFTTYFPFFSLIYSLPVTESLNIHVIYGYVIIFSILLSILMLFFWWKVSTLGPVLMYEHLLLLLLFLFLLISSNMLLYKIYTRDNHLCPVWSFHHYIVSLFSPQSWRRRVPLAPAKQLPKMLQLLLDFFLTCSEFLTFLE